MPIQRREFLKTMLATSAGVMLPKWSMALSPDETLASGAREAFLLDTLSGKKPLIKKSFRPPNYETPIEYFDHAFTPNEAFYVRYHLSNIPEVNVQEWKLRIEGDAVENPYELSLDDLKRNFEQVELAAFCMCSGNRRGFFSPHVPGVQWGNGAMGNAMWKGVRLRDVLNKAGLKKEALEIAFDRADSGVIDKTPDFRKSIPAWKALDENTLIAYEMNGEALPHWNGFPARIVVPGWTATYWMKHVISINALSQPLKSFWMAPAYRIPKGKFPVIDRFVSQETDVNTPITEMVVNSLMTSIRNGQRFKLGAPVPIKGVVWDGGYGIRSVEVSVDGGKTWMTSELKKDYGRYSWRQFEYLLRPHKKGKYIVMAKASNRLGATQTFELILNPAGYHHNVVQQIEVEVV